MHFNYTDIEFVCVGNRGRSPLAEAFGRMYLDKHKILGTVNLSSSGISVDALKRKDPETQKEILGKMIHAAYNQGVLTQEQANLVRQGRERELDVGSTLDTIFSEVRKREAEQRKPILKRFGVLDYINSREPVQTDVREDAQVIFPMDFKALDKVRMMYQRWAIDNGRKSPHIELLNIADPILVTKKEYESFVEEVRENVMYYMKRLYEEGIVFDS